MKRVLLVIAFLAIVGYCVYTYRHWGGDGLGRISARTLTTLYGIVVFVGCLFVISSSRRRR